MSLYQRLKGHAEFQPDKTAIDSEAGQLSYLQLKVLTDSCIDFFHALGLEKGDRVAILSLNHPDWFIATFAAARCGVVLVPLNWRLSIDELRYVIADSEPLVLLHDQEFSNQALELQKSFEHLQLVGFANSDFPPEVSDSINQNAAFDEPDGSDTPFLIVYTSGTTGRPKGAVLSQKAIMCSAEMSQHMTDLTVNDRVLNVLPLFHVGGLNIQPLPALLYGATLILHARFSPVDAVNALTNNQITLINTVPTLLRAMLASSAWNPQSYRSLRAVSIGSTDVPVSLINNVQSCGIPLIQVYGATETGPLAIYQRIEHASKTGSIGKAGLLCDVRLCNKEGEEVAQGESGEIQIKGCNILNHYWRNEQATADCMNDGWFGTGDVAHRDSEGFFWFDDRLKHVIISGGENIYPAEIERVLRDVPGVDEVAIVGRADDQWGQVPVAVIVGTAEKDSIIVASQSLAKFKRPADIIFMDSLPRNALGKVQVHLLQTMLD